MINDRSVSPVNADYMIKIVYLVISDLTISLSYFYLHFRQGGCQPCCTFSRFLDLCLDAVGFTIGLYHHVVFGPHHIPYRGDLPSSTPLDRS